MNIDFHYGVIYAVARLGGLDVAEARTVAHSCQYVDDATTDGLLKFADGERFERIASAHEMIDYKNEEDDQNRRIWVPFHFLPGAQGKSVAEKAVCRPNSDVAKDVVRRALNAHGAYNALHRLGVTLHVYVDTWAHQGFSGVASDYNRITHLEGDDHDHETWLGKLKETLISAGEKVESLAIDALSGLGHGAALHFPDMPWATWRYRCKVSEEMVHRDNLPDFVQAADMACKVVQAFKAKSQEFESQPGLPPDAKAALGNLLRENCSHDPDERLSFWKEALASGKLPGLNEALPDYIAKGPGSWKHAATRLAGDDDSGEAPVWSEVFEQSDYRKFHDATKEHRFVAVQEVLPEAGLRLC
ncbi:DUF6765 family protein [Trinickia fusca]|uniref:Uncharacterized protein n=1 Tax=Trinickia fusca TaxID=2419777 RepID=A0A494XBT2_9BURK|nr:DUF6765 family protein [Trinickia fusca]RKP48297.1 hypothetical protein D7S89_13315 [Trinickia fusca]